VSQIACRSPGLNGMGGSEAVNEWIAPATGCIRVQAKARPAAQDGRLSKGRNARLRPEVPRPEGRGRCAMLA
jgi:hypothetical protein